MTLISVIIPTSVDVSPSLAAYDPADGRLAYPELLGDFGVVHALRKGTDGTHIVFGQLRLWQSFSSRDTAFSDHIVRVIRVAPQEQVVGPDAGSDVAVMQDENPSGYLSEGESPRMAMGHLLESVDSDSAVAVSVPMAEPNPTLVRLVDLGPETRGRRR